MFTVAVDPVLHEFSVLCWLCAFLNITPQRKSVSCKTSSCNPILLYWRPVGLAIVWDGGKEPFCNHMIKPPSFRRSMSLFCALHSFYFLRNISNFILKITDRNWKARFTEPWINNKTWGKWNIPETSWKIPKEHKLTKNLQLNLGCTTDYI